MVDQEKLDKCYETVLSQLKSGIATKESSYFWNDPAREAKIKDNLRKFLSMEPHTLQDSLSFYVQNLGDTNGAPMNVPKRKEFQAFFLTVGKYLGGDCKLVEQNTTGRSSKVLCLNVNALFGDTDCAADKLDNDDGTVYICNLPYCKSRGSRTATGETGKERCYKSVRNKKNFFRHLGSHFVCVDSGATKKHYNRDLKYLVKLLPKYILTMTESDVGDAVVETKIVGEKPPVHEKVPYDYKTGDWFHYVNPNFEAKYTS